MKFFFLILLTIVLIYLSIKPEGFDASNNSLDSLDTHGIFSKANMALFTVVFVLFIIISFLVIKLRNNTNS
jgi:hypothetical protein